MLAQPFPVCLPVAGRLLGGLAEVLAYVLKAVTLSDLPHDGTAKARTGTEAHQQHVYLRLLVLPLHRAAALEPVTGGQVPPSRLPERPVS